MAINEILNPILNPLLNLSPFLVVLIISIIVSLITTLIYKYTTDQKLMKELKAQTKKYQDKLKSLRDKPDKALKVQKEMMNVNMQYMKSSFKPMFFTFIPIILFFGWLGANLAFMPLLDNATFGINVSLAEDVQGNFSLVLPDNLSMDDEVTKFAENSVSWKNIKGSCGEYNLKLVSEKNGEEQYVPILITDKQKYINPIHKLDSNTFDTVLVGNKKLIIFKDIYLFQSIPWINGFGWLGAYILFSLIFSTTLRKIMKIS